MTNLNCWACFTEYDEYISIGTFASDEDAYIAAAEHGVDREGEFYVAPVEYVENKQGIIEIWPGSYD